MYEYLYECIREDIMQGRIKENEKLPSKRMLAKQHHISLKTVENAYEQLLLEGYLYTKERSGYYAGAVETGYEVKESPAIYEPGQQQEEYQINLANNQAALDKFPYSQWAKVMREVLSIRERELLDTVPFQGIYELRKEIAEYLYEYRGMQVSPERIIVGAGTEYLYGRLIHLLGRDCVYAVEDPGYQKITKLYAANDVTWKYIGIDEYGISVEELAKSGADVVHVSPGHHFPTGTIMPVGRRQKLLEWAAEERDRYIIEDDYDSEFRFVKRPVPAVQSMDMNHRVIYMNNFSKTLAPSIRISYMVLPQKLMDRYVSTMNFYSCTVSAFEQYAMVEFMQKGYFERHIQRMKNYYKSKRDSILKLLQESPLMTLLVIEEKDAGNHFLLKIDTQLSDVQIKWAMKDVGIKLDFLSEFCMQNKEEHMHTMIINYSNLKEEEFQAALRRLEEILL
ncbi:MAG: PLP-dependent aminotransferase family protein [Lachnospiraceae bacterium]|nr:PLP-dependent aminotransferase family protein [Lachnospiraceae bacterium]